MEEPEVVRARWRRGHSRHAAAAAARWRERRRRAKHHRRRHYHYDDGDVSVIKILYIQYI